MFNTPVSAGHRAFLWEAGTGSSIHTVDYGRMMTVLDALAVRLLTPFLRCFTPEMINVPDDDGTTALHGAAKQGAPEVVRLLLKHGARADVPDRLGYTAVHMALLEDTPELARMMLKEQRGPVQHY